jgi:hypothetical protein
MNVPFHAVRVRPGLWTLIFTSALLFGCGGDPTPPQLSGSVSVTVTTVGSGEDADGYTVTVGSRESTVPMAGSTTIDGLAPGSYDVTLGGLAVNCSVTGEATRLVTVTQSGSATVSFEVDCVFDGAGIWLAESVCPALSPAATQGMPLDVVPIGGIPAGFERPVLARMSWPGGSQVTPGLVLDDSGDAAVMIPLHPSLSLDGGDVTVRISDETQTCPPFTFTILPLPAAPGEITTLADLAQELLDEQASLFGTTREELLGTPMSELEPALRLPALAQIFVDEPSGESSLRAFADGTAPDFEPADLDFVERLLARTGFQAGMEAALTAIRAGGPAPTAGVVSSRGSGPARALSPGLAVDCVVTVDMDAALLDECMTLARDKALTPRTDTIQQRAIFAMDMAAMLGSRTIAAPISSLVSFSRLYDGALADNLPSSFVELTVTPDPAEFREDQAGPGKWSPALATATSNGWNLDELLTTLILGRVTPDIRRVPRLSYIQKRILAERGAGTIRWTYNAVDDFFQGLLEQLLGVLVDRGVALTDGVLTVPPLTYGPVDVSDPEWTDSRIVTGTSIELPSHGLYEPMEPGTSLIEIVTAVGKFGGTSIDSGHQEISIGRLALSISPAEVFLAPGQDTTFALTVLNALHPDSVEIVADSTRQGMAEISFGTGDTHTIVYTAPDAPAPNSTDVLGVRHTAAGGARGQSSEPRSASAIIRFAGIDLLPVQACVAPGQEVQLDVVVTGPGPAPDLVWSYSDGDVSSTGLFTAPNQTGDVEITVAFASNPAITDTITVSVADCVCGFSVNVQGQTPYIGQPGDSVAYLTNGPQSPILYVYLYGEGGSTVWFTLDPSAGASSPGSYPLSSIDGGLGFGARFDIYGSTRLEEGNVGTLLISDFVMPDTALVGEVVGGTVREDRDSANPPLSISATFSVYPERYSYLSGYMCTVR